MDYKPGSLIKSFDQIFEDSKSSDDVKSSFSSLRQQLKYAALSINIAGRLRMLLQKSCKEYFMIICQFNIIDSRRQLKRSQSAFEQSLLVLTRNIDKGIFFDHESSKISAKINDVKKLWDLLKEHLDHCFLDQDVDPKVTKFIAKLNPEILEQIEDLVCLFENMAYDLHDS